MEEDDCIGERRMSQKRILVVEDEGLVAKDIENSLLRAGYLVAGVAGTAAEALTLATSAKPDVVLMDIRLKGGVDGITVAENLQVEHDVPVIFLTAHADSNTLDRAKLTGPFGYIRKPFGEDDLRTAIEIALYRHDMEVRLHHAEEQMRQVEKMEATARLAGGVAHDFNNLLTVILGYSEDLLCRLHGRDYDEVLEIKNAGLLASAVTRQLLTFSQKQVVQPRLVSLNELIAASTHLLRAALGERASVTTILAPELRRVQADPAQVEQVLMNLTLNAREAMPEGGHLLIETANEEDRVRLSVQDTGCGMTPDVVKRIFDPFFTTRLASRAAGLGLSTVHGIVTRANGEIRIQTEPGRGTRFDIFLPVAADGATPVNVPTVSPVRDRQTVLLVEDEPRVRRLLHNVFENKGFNLLEAGDAEEAQIIGELHDGMIHVLVTDVMLPGINGPQLAQHLRRVRPDMGVLLISGYPFDALDGDTLAGEAFPFLAKPFSADELLSKVQEVIEETRSRAAAG